MISNKCQNILQIAYDEALKSPCLHKHGCVACINGKIISRGYNNYNTWSSDKFSSYHGSCHAEIKVLRDIWTRFKHLHPNKIKKFFKKITIYVVRITSNGLMNSAPCSDCMKKLKELNVKNIVYSNHNGGVTICKTVNYHTNRLSFARL